MTKIILIDPSMNFYENNKSFDRVSQEDVLFEGRTVTKLTYRDSHSLIWKTLQVALAALLTLATLGLAFCFQKGMIWKEALAQFKDRIVYQNVAVQPAAQAIAPCSSKPLAPTVVPAASLNPADLAL